MSETVNKKDHESSIYQEDEIKDALLEDVTPKHVTYEIMGFDVLKVLKFARHFVPVDIPTNELLNNLVRYSYPKKYQNNQIRLKQNKPVNVRDYEVNDFKF